MSECVCVCVCMCVSLQVSFLKRAAMWSGLSKLVLIWVNTSMFSTTSFCTDTVNVTLNCGFTLFHPHCSLSKHLLRVDRQTTEISTWISEFLLFIKDQEPRALANNFYNYNRQGFRWADRETSDVVKTCSLSGDVFCTFHWDSLRLWIFTFSSATCDEMCHIRLSLRNFIP